jgi:hypothetical protein
MILIALGVVVAALVSTWIGVRPHQRASAGAIDQLVRAGNAHNSPAPVDPRALDHLPLPVARYLRLALLSPKQIQEVRIRQTGTLRTDAVSGRWMPFDAEQLIVPEAPGFLWNARVTVAPLLHVRVRDAFIDGRGWGQVSLMSAFTLSVSAIS